MIDDFLNEYEKLKSTQLIAKLDLFKKYINVHTQSNPKKLQIRAAAAEYIELLKEYHELEIDSCNYLFEDIYEHSKLIKEYQYSEIVSYEKYKGLTFSHVVSRNPHYIIWLIIHHKYFAIEDIFFLEKMAVKNLDYIKALEINLLKKLAREKYLQDEDDRLNYYKEDPLCGLISQCMLQSV